MKYQVWYAKGTGFGNLKPDPTNLDRTHVHLKDLDAGEPVDHRDVEADTKLALEHIFHQMQGEVWSSGSPHQAEAQALIRSKGLRHTSMSMGDVIVDDEGGVWLAAFVGFDKLN
jgi:hypothetical protein